MYAGVILITGRILFVLIYLCLYILGIFFIMLAEIGHVFIESVISFIWILVKSVPEILCLSNMHYSSPTPPFHSNI